MRFIILSFIVLSILYFYVDFKNNEDKKSN